MTPRRQVAVGALVTGLVLASTGAAYAQAGDPVVLSRGHVDVFDPELRNGELLLALRDDTQPGGTVWRDPAAVLLQVLPESELQVPDLPAYSFLGEPGDPVWLLPQIQDDHLLWPGWNTQRLDPAQIDGWIEFAVTSLDGPGELKIYIEGPLGLPDAIMVDTADPGVTDVWSVSVPTHAHANWAFTREGQYTLTAQARATLVDGTSVSTDDVQYTFVVGELPDPGDPASQSVVATIDDADGALIISVDPDDRHVVLPPLELAADGQSRETSGDLRPVTVTDTRAGAPGWAASAQVSDFLAGSARVAGNYLGWTPRVLAQADGQGVESGAVVPAGFPSGDGLSVSQLLASAASGAGRGTATVDAALELRVPTDVSPGTYRATLTFTVI